MTDSALLIQQLGPRLRRARITSLLTVRAVAERLGIDHSVIVRYEHGEILPPLDRLAALANVYQVSLASLLVVNDVLAPVVTMLEQIGPEQISVFAKLLQQAVDTAK